MNNTKHNGMQHGAEPRHEKDKDGEHTPQTDTKPHPTDSRESEKTTTPDRS